MNTVILLITLFVGFDGNVKSASFEMESMAQCQALVELDTTSYCEVQNND